MVILVAAAAKPELSTSAISVAASRPTIVLMIFSRRFGRTIEQRGWLEKPAGAGARRYRDRIEALASYRHCEEQSDEAIDSFLMLYGLLRFARNDE
jgi:hypothetical protein